MADGLSYKGFSSNHILNFRSYRQHWFISRLNGASVTAGGFPPNNSNVLMVTTSANHVYVFDVEEKQLGQWCRHHARHLPRRFQEFPGEVIGLSFPPAINSTSVIVYSARAMCLIDYGIPVGQDGYMELSFNGPNLSWAEYESVNVKEKRKRNSISHELIAAFSKKLKENGKLKKTNQECRPPKSQNFDFFVFRDQALFVGHLSETSLLVVEKSWQEVLKTFGAPVHRHIFGT